MSSRGGRVGAIISRTLLSTALTIRSAHSFSYVNTQKRYDTSKKSISLMLKASNDVLVEAMEVNGQFNSITAAYLMNELKSNQSLGQFCKLIEEIKHEDKAEWQPYLSTFIKSVSKAAKLLNSNAQKIDLHKQDGVGRFLRTIGKLQSYFSPDHWSLVALFLGGYMRKCSLLCSRDRVAIMAYLLQMDVRSTWILQEARLVVQNVDAQQLGSAMQAAGAQEKLLLLESVVNLMAIIRALQRCQDTHPQVPAEKLSEKVPKLLQLYHQVLESPDFLTTAVNAIDPELLFHPVVLTSGQFDRASQLICKILSPDFLLLTKTHQSLLAVLFDRLLVCFDRREQRAFMKMLDHYTKSIRCLNGKAQSDHYGGSSLVGLYCQLPFQNRALSAALAQHLEGRLDSMVYSKKQSKSYSDIFMCLHMLGMLMQSKSLDELTYNRLRVIYISKFEELNGTTPNQIIGTLEGYFNQRLRARKGIQQGQSEQSDEGKKNSKKELNSLSEELGIQVDSDRIKQRRFPVCLIYNETSRLKIILWNLYFYCCLSKSAGRAHLVAHLASNEALRQPILSSLAYPGILDALLVLGTMLPDGGSYFTNVSGKLAKDLNKVSKLMTQSQKSRDVLADKHLVGGVELLSRKVYSIKSEGDLSRMAINIANSSIFQCRIMRDPSLESKLQQVLRQFIKNTDSSKVQAPPKLYGNVHDYPFFYNYVIATKKGRVAVVITTPKRKKQLIESRSAATVMRSPPDGALTSGIIGPDLSDRIPRINDKLRQLGKANQEAFYVAFEQDIGFLKQKLDLLLKSQEKTVSK